MTKIHYHVKSISLGDMYLGEEKNSHMKTAGSGSWLFSVHITESCDLFIYAKCLQNFLDGYFIEIIKYCHRVPFRE